VPEWVFCSEVGGAPDASNTVRRWLRLRRRAQKHGVRPFKLHCTRHTWATYALEAGRSLRRVADVLGHADPAFTLRVYAHAIPAEEGDLSFADFGRGPAGEVLSDDLKRPYAAPRLEQHSRDGIEDDELATGIASEPEEFEAGGPG